MSVTINTTPPAVAPCGINNPIAFKLLGSNRIYSPGLTCNRSIVKSSTISNGDSIVLSWGDNEITFSFDTGYASDDTGLLINPAASVSSIAAAIALNYYVNRDFTIAVVGSTITFYARAKGSAYNLLIDITDCSGFTAGATSQTGSDDTLNSNYKILAQLYVEETWGSGTFSRITELFSDADSSNYATIYLEQILRGLLRDKADLPTFNQNSITDCSHILRKYKADFSELYGDTPAVQKLYPSGNYYALNGEIATDQYPGFDFMTKLAGQKFFLSQRPQKIDTWIGAHQYLYFMNYLNTYSNFSVWLKVFCTDNSAVTTNYATISSLDKYETKIIPAGYNQLDIDTILSTTGKTAYMYEIWVTPVGSSTVIMRPMRFILQAQPFFSRFFIFQNKFGGFDTLLCADQATTRLVDKEQREAFVASDYAKTDGSLKSSVKTSYEKHSIRSILLRKDEAEAALEIISSRHVYLAAENNYICVDIEGGDIKATDENEDLFYIEFAYRYSLQASDAFIKPKGDYSSDFSQDFDI